MQAGISPHLDAKIWYWLDWIFDLAEMEVNANAQFYRKIKVLVGKLEGKKGHQLSSMDGILVGTST